MELVNHSKCKQYEQVRHVSELKENSSGVGMVCFDLELCKKQQSKHETKGATHE
jgi:hypothetical protein